MIKIKLDIKHKAPPNDKLRYHVTDSADEYHEVQKIRKHLYNEDNRFIGFREFIYIDDCKETLEENEYAVIAKNNKKIVGSLKLSILDKKNHNHLLPLEKDINYLVNGKKFCLENFFRLKENNIHRVAELNKIFLIPEFRKRKHLKEIFYTALEFCDKKNIEYLYGLGDIYRARLYRSILKSFDKKVRIHEDIDIPIRKDYENKKMILMSMNLKKVI